jgi:dTDP-4-amino-4,6-dideoxygalactose transaminase
MMKNKISFVDLHAQYLSIKNDVDESIQDVIENSYFVRGPYVDRFEAAFSELISSTYCISCANGTDSLYIAMRGLGIKLGDEVIAPAHSWISTTETISQAGGRVVFCDTGEDDFLINVREIESKITPRTVGIIPVHLYGQPAEMDEIMKIAKRYGLWVIEDCAQAHLAKYKGRIVGSIGDVASFSFYPGKNLGAMGDAGAILTNNAELANWMTMFARHGGLKKGDHLIEGINSRMDGIQAAILLAKLKYIVGWTARRREIAVRYSMQLDDITGIQTPRTNEDVEHVWHLYVIKADRRDLLKAYLDSNGVMTVINYPVALPYLPAYKYLGHSINDFPNALSNQSQILSLPIFPELSDEQVDWICELIRIFYSGT